MNTPTNQPPAHDAPVLAWALFYFRNGLGIPLPIRSPEEAAAFAEWETRRWAAEHPQATDAEREAPLSSRSTSTASVRKDDPRDAALRPRGSSSPAMGRPGFWSVAAGVSSGPGRPAEGRGF